MTKTFGDKHAVLDIEFSADFNSIIGVYGVKSN